MIDYAMVIHKDISEQNMFRAMNRVNPSQTEVVGNNHTSALYRIPLYCCTAVVQSRCSSVMIVILLLYKTSMMVKYNRLFQNQKFNKIFLFIRLKSSCTLCSVKCHTGSYKL